MAAATSVYTGGYSWLWWLNRPCEDGTRWFPDVDPGLFACFGHGGQEGMAVLPGSRVIVSWVGKELHQDRERGNRAFRLLQPGKAVNPELAMSSRLPQICTMSS
ncbi:MAG: hypothetical protein R3C28_09735 [Pirellulaceae bacterium]